MPAWRRWSSLLAGVDDDLVAADAYAALIVGASALAVGDDQQSERDGYAKCRVLVRDHCLSFRWQCQLDDRCADCKQSDEHQDEHLPVGKHGKAVARGPG